MTDTARPLVSCKSAISTPKRARQNCQALLHVAALQSLEDWAGCRNPPALAVLIKLVGVQVWPVIHGQLMQRGLKSIKPQEVRHSSSPCELVRALILVQTHPAVALTTLLASVSALILSPVVPTACMHVLHSRVPATACAVSSHVHQCIEQALHGCRQLVSQG